jgi:phosphotriesterase-related protein
MIYAHEHLTIDLSGQKNDIDCRLDDYDAALKELSGIYQKGVRVVVDQTARGMGRNPVYTQKLADDAKLIVLHATGYYKEPFLPEECHILSEIQLANIMLRELTEGIDDTGLKASLIGEVGTSKDAILPIEAKILRAAAQAHSETGAPICTHTTLGLLGIEQIAILREFNVNLSQVVISHVDLTGDVDYMLRLLDSGVNIAFDTIGKLSYKPDTDRALWLAELCRRGFAEQIVLSMDITRKSHYSANGGLGYAYLLDTFIPMARNAGCDEADVEKMLVKNPSRIYSGTG